MPFLALAVSVILCFVYAQYRGTYSSWWNSHGGGVPYVLFWILLWYLAFPKRAFILPICLGCVLMTCLLEFGQLWDPEPLASFRRTKFGAAWLGYGFDWADLPPYFIGGGVGFGVLLLINRRAKVASRSTDNGD